MRRERILIRALLDETHGDPAAWEAFVEELRALVKRHEPQIPHLRGPDVRGGTVIDIAFVPQPWWQRLLRAVGVIS